MEKQILLYSNIIGYPTSVSTIFLRNLSLLEETENTKLKIIIQFSSRFLDTDLTNLLEELKIADRFIFKDIDEKGYRHPISIFHNILTEGYFPIDYFICLSPYSIFNSFTALAEAVENNEIIPNQTRLFPVLNKTGVGNRKIDFTIINPQTKNLENIQVSPFIIEIFINPLLGIILDPLIVESIHSLFKSKTLLGYLNNEKFALAIYGFMFASNPRNTENGQRRDFIECLDLIPYDSADLMILPIIQGLEIAYLNNIVKDNEEADDILQNLGEKDQQECLKYFVGQILTEDTALINNAYDLLFHMGQAPEVFKKYFRQFNIGKSYLVADPVLYPFNQYMWTL